MTTSVSSLSHRLDDGATAAAILALPKCRDLNLFTAAIFVEDRFGTNDAVADGPGAYVVFTREPTGPGESASAWYAAMPGGKPQVLLNNDEDAYSIHIATGDKDSTPTIGVTSMDGGLEIVALGGRGPTSRFSIP